MNSIELAYKIKKEMKVSEPNFDKFKLLPGNEIEILRTACRNTNFNRNNIKLYNWIIKHTIELYKTNKNNNIFNDYINLDLLKNIIKLKKEGPKYLVKIKFILDDVINYNLLNDNLIVCAKRGNLNTFKILESYKPLNNPNELLISSVNNCDDRLFKYLLDKIKLYEELVLEIIRCIKKINEDDKYKLKKIKILSEYTNLSNIFDDMLIILSNDHIKICSKLFDYYYNKPLDTDIIKMIIYNCHSIDVYNKFLIQDKIYFEIYYPISFANTFSIANPKLFENLLLKLGIEEINFIIAKKKSNHDMLNMIIKVLVNNNLVMNVMEIAIKKNSNSIFKLLFCTRFYVKKELGLVGIKINFILHRLRLWAKRYKKNKQINHNANMLSVLNELKTYEQNKNIPVLKYGSIKYQLSLESFNNTKYIKSDKLNNCLIRQEFKGVLVNSLPIDPYPNCDEINKYNIKAEYIEDKDLYLVYDIDVPDTTIIERYEYLRALHPYTCNAKLEIINNYNEFINIISNEENNISHFINSNDELIKWYPKVACYVYNELYIKDNIIISPFIF